MKKILMLLAVAAIVVSFSSCNKEETKTDLLTKPSKGWVLSKATSSPAYHMSDGSYATDLMNDGYLNPTEIDDRISFMENGSEIINPGKVIPEDSLTRGYLHEVAATWSFDKDETHINMQIPFFYDETDRNYDKDMETCEILELSKNEFRIKYSFNVVDAKEKYSFTLTYEPAK